MLVHCEAGQSRSASIVAAALMAIPCLAHGLANLEGEEAARGLNWALEFMRKQRPQVRPNDGFMEQLRRGAWMDAVGAEDTVKLDWF